MKNGIKYLALTLSAFVIGMTVNNFAVSNVPSKIAVVDVQKVLNTLVKTGKIDIRTNTIYVKNLKEIQRQIDLKRKKS